MEFSKVRRELVPVGEDKTEESFELGDRGIRCVAVETTLEGLPCGSDYQGKKVFLDCVRYSGVGLGINVVPRG